ncbi:MAG: hypothetical protein WAU00_13540 [Caldilinea sp.]
MGFSPFSAIGLLLANGPGILLLSALTASIVLFWDWRWALSAAVIVLLALSSIGAALHTLSPLVTAGQWLASVVAGVLLGLAGRFHPAAANTHTNGNWLLRLIALGFMVGAWWVIDPGVSLPLFTQGETDLIFWLGLCGLLIVSLSSAPLHTGIGLMLMMAPLQAIAAVLLPGSGMALLVSIAQILLALSCAYLVLAQPSLVRASRRTLPLPGETTPTPMPAQTIQPAQTTQSAQTTQTGQTPLRFPKPRQQQPASLATDVTSSPGQEPQAPVEKSA